MKTYIFLIFLLFVSVLSVNNSYAQQHDSLKQKQIKFYSRVLSANQDTATRVSNIMSTYKDGIKKVVADATLSEEAKRTKINELIDEKNKKLGLLLSPAQQAKIIPSTERKINQSSK